MRNKRAPIPFDLARLADADRVVYANDTNLRDVSSHKSTNFAAKKYRKNIKNEK